MSDTTQVGSALSPALRVARIAARKGSAEPASTAPDEMPAVDLAGRRAAYWRDRVPSKFLWANLGDLDRETAAIVAEWTVDPRGRNLVVLGPVGVGKTHAAYAALRGQVVDRGMALARWSVVDLLDALRPSNDHAPVAWEHVANVDRLLLDDVGAEKPTEWTSERIYALLNARWEEELPTVATSNLAPTALAAHLGERAFSRLVGGAVVVELNGPDRRRAR